MYFSTPTLSDPQKASQSPCVPCGHLFVAHNLGFTADTASLLSTNQIPGNPHISQLLSFNLRHSTAGIPLPLPSTILKVFFFLHLVGQVSQICLAFKTFSPIGQTTSKATINCRVIQTGKSGAGGTGLYIDIESALQHSACHFSHLYLRSILGVK